MGDVQNVYGCVHEDTQNRNVKPVDRAFVYHIWGQHYARK